jgi:hypothetical protein
VIAKQHQCAGPLSGRTKGASHSHVCNRKHHRRNPESLDTLTHKASFGDGSLGRVCGRSAKAWRSAILRRIVAAEGQEENQYYREYYRHARGLVGAIQRGAADPFKAATTDRFGRSTVIKLPLRFPEPTREQFETRKAWEEKHYGPELNEFEGLRSKDWHARVIAYLEYRALNFAKLHKPSYGEFQGFNPYSKAILETVCAFNCVDFVPRAMAEAVADSIDERIFA